MAAYSNTTKLNLTQFSLHSQIYVAIITYCLVAIIESELKLNRDIYKVMRILGSSMLVKDNIKDLFSHAEYDILYKNDGQLELDFTS